MKVMFATKRRFAIAVLLVAGVVLGAGLLAYLMDGKDAALWKVLKLYGRGRGVVPTSSMAPSAPSTTA
jgi:hypothetical protein